MGIADSIAEIIEGMLDRSGGSVEIRRNELARKLGYVPSQINYVITTRFTPERGYLIESRRGGGGYVRIIRRELDANEYLMHFFHAVGDSLDARSAAVFTDNLAAAELITPRERLIIQTALSVPEDDVLRAKLMKQIVYSILK